MADINATPMSASEKLKNEQIPEVGYSVEEIAYRGRLISELVSDQEMRDGVHDEFDGIGYIERYNDNKRRANTFIRPRQNKSDVNIATGTTRQKITALTAVINNLNLTSDITAHDNLNNIPIASLGEAMESIIRKTEELEGDELKKLNRYFELITQGEISVEETFVEPLEIRKQLKKKFDGKIKSAEWTRRIVKTMGKPERNILYGPGVYPGDITQFDINKQPHMFTVEIKPYAETESIYGKWERWKFVSRDLKRFATTQEASTKYDMNWTLGEYQKDHCEIVKYQNPWTNEYMILINGVMMLPVGFPLPWGNRYNITHQILEPISPFFFYGKSTPSKFKSLDDVFDEMLKIMVLKNQRSLVPPVANLTGRVLSSKMFMPAAITNGIDPDGVKPFFEKNEAVNVSEYQMFKEIGQMIDNNSVTPQFAGQESRNSRETAIAVLNRQRQAEVQLGLTIFACSMLEKKLAYQRIDNILQNWFDPVDKRVDEIRNELINVYRSVSIEGNIQNKGRGQIMVDITDGERKSPQEIFDMENNIEKSIGFPVRKIILDVDKIKKLRDSARLVWMVSVLSRPKQSSELQQVMFRNMLVDAQFFGPDVNRENLKEEFALVWNKNPSKMFIKSGINPAIQAKGIQGPGTNIAEAVGTMNASGGVKTPSLTGGGI